MIRSASTRQMAFAAVLALAGLVAAACGGSIGGTPDLVSTFDSDVEGWSIEGDGSAPVHRVEDENGNGYIESTDESRGVTWLWVSPAGWAGDRSGFAGGSLSFDLYQSSVTSGFDDPDVVLVSGDAELSLSIGQPPGELWTRYVLPLDESHWEDLTTGGSFAEGQFRDILEDLREIRIRGEYRNGADIGGLDNVRLSTDSADEISVSLAP